MRAKSGRTANQEKEVDHYVALGCYFSGDCAGSCALWIYRDCLGCGGNCEISLFPVPGCLPGALYRWNERGEKVLETFNLLKMAGKRADDHGGKLEA
jgi:hypothetical protein